MRSLIGWVAALGLTVVATTPLHAGKIEVKGVHLCCAKCVKAADKALKSVPGVKENTAAKDAKSFDVTGDFNDKEVFTALQNEGLTGKVAK